MRPTDVLKTAQWWGLRVQRKLDGRWPWMLHNSEASVYRIARQRMTWWLFSDEVCVSSNRLGDEEVSLWQDCWVSNSRLLRDPARRTKCFGSWEWRANHLEMLTPNVVFDERLKTDLPLQYSALRLANNRANKITTMVPRWQIEKGLERDSYTWNLYI